MRGTYVRGLTRGDQWRLDCFEGSQYERMRLRLNLIDEKGNVGEEVDAETYVWAENVKDLEDGEWDFEEFRREKMGRWVGSNTEYEGELAATRSMKVGCDGLLHICWDRSYLRGRVWLILLW